MAAVSVAAAAKKELESGEPALEQGETKAGVGLHTANPPLPYALLVIMTMLIGKPCHVATLDRESEHLNFTAPCR